MNMFTKIFLGFLVFTLMGISELDAGVPLAPNEPVDVNYLLNNGNTGRKFIFAIPANEIPTARLNALEIYIASRYDTEVRIDLPFEGRITKTCKANSLFTLSSKTGELNHKNLEIRKTETVINQTITIESDEPVAVYVLNAKPVSSEGFMALPVEVWGLDYLHCSYYDFNESKKWATGFLVVAAYDDTEIHIELKGKGDNYSSTRSGKKLGYKYIEVLNKGEVFCVEGKGLTRGIYDLSGTSISADKPVGLISYHQRTMIPATIVTSGRDHLSEMMMPVSAWGKNYTTVELNRKKDKGDLFRIMASEDNTIVNISWFDKNTNQKIGSRQQIVLEKKGDFKEILEEAAKDGALESIRGTSIFSADKPILVMQYSYSANWDNAKGNYDPFMFQVSSEEQYVPAAIFETPLNQSYNDNYFNIIANPGDHSLLSSQKILDRLNSLTIDGKQLSLLAPKFVKNRIPNTDLYWATVKVTQGMHKVIGDGKITFGGYVYGFATFDSYGWPAGVSINHIDIPNDKVPTIISSQNQTNQDKYDISIKGVKLSAIEAIDNSHNFNIKFNINGKEVNFNTDKQTSIYFDRFPFVDNIDLNISVIDKFEDAKVKLLVRDMSGNYSIKEFIYTAELVADKDLIAIATNISNVEIIKTNKNKNFTSSIKNISKKNIIIKEIKLIGSDNFALSRIYKNIPLAKNQILDVDLDFLADRDGEYSSTLNIAIKDAAKEYTVEYRVKSGSPVYAVDETMNFNDLEPNDAYSQSYTVRNISKVHLEISEIKIVDSDLFVLKKNPKYPYPIIVAPNSTMIIGEITFKPKKVGDYFAKVLVSSDGKSEKITQLVGKCTKLSVEDQLIEEGYSLIANIENSLLKIKYSVGHASNVSFEIIDQLGNIVSSANATAQATTEQTKQMSISALSQGVYFIRMITNKHTLSSKFLLNK